MSWLPPVPIIAHLGADLRHLQHARALGRLHGVDGAEGLRLYPGSRRPEPRGRRRAALQPFADVIKLLFKEELRPKAADALLFAIAPIISAGAAFAAFSVVPFGTSRRRSSGCWRSRFRCR